MGALLQVTIVVVTLTGILHQFRDQQNLYRRDDAPHKVKRHVLLRGVGTHPVDEKYVKVAATMRRGVLNNLSFRNLEPCCPKRDMQVADRASTAGSRADFMTFCPPLSQQGVREYMRAEC